MPGRPRIHGEIEILDFGMGILDYGLNFILHFKSLMVDCNLIDGVTAFLVFLS